MKQNRSASRLPLLLIASVAVLLLALELGSVFLNASTPLERLELGGLLDRGHAWAFARPRRIPWRCKTSVSRWCG